MKQFITQTFLTVYSDEEDEEDRSFSVIGIMETRFEDEDTVCIKREPIQTEIYPDFGEGTSSSSNVVQWVNEEGEESDISEEGPENEAKIQKIIADLLNTSAGYGKCIFQYFNINKGYNLS